MWYFLTNNGYSDNVNPTLIKAPNDGQGPSKR